VTEVESVDRPVPRKDSRTWRVLLTQLHWDDEGNPESFVFAYATKRVSSHEEYLGGVRTRPQSRKTKPFLGGWSNEPLGNIQRGCPQEIPGES
jgi:hypothetical protein